MRWVSHRSPRQRRRPAAQTRLTAVVSMLSVVEANSRPRLPGLSSSSIRMLGRGLKTSPVSRAATWPVRRLSRGRSPKSNFEEAFSRAPGHPVVIEECRFQGLWGNKICRLSTLRQHSLFDLQPISLSAVGGSSGPDREALRQQCNTVQSQFLNSSEFVATWPRSTRRSSSNS